MNTIRRRVLMILPWLLCLSAPVVGAEDLLLGRVRPSAIVGISDEWRANRDAYEPNEDDVRRIAALEIPLVLDVYFGSWCSDSRREVPRLLKILDRAAPASMKVRYYGLDRSKKRPARLARRGAIERVPTFILSSGGREVGRIVEKPPTPLEHELALLIEKAAPPPAP